MTTFRFKPTRLPLSPIFPIILAVMLCALGASTARAVVVASGAENNTPPWPALIDPGFANIGVSSTGGASVTYLGNRWILTANHVTINNNLSPIRFGDFVSDVVPSSKVRLLNTNGLGADLVMWQLEDDPHLPCLLISSDTPAIGSAVTMIGNGRTRGAPLGDGSGYNIDTSAQTIRWGTNVVSATGLWENDGYGSGRAFHTKFDNLGPTSNEAQASRGDSGGGAFFLNGTRWELAGIMYLGSPDDSPLRFGDESSFVDLRYYRTQIMSVFASTLPVVRGDANGDGLIDFTDLGILLNNFDQPGTYSDGDFDVSGRVDFSDMGLLLNNFNLSVDTPISLTPVPEPGCVALGAIGLAGLLAFVWRRRHAAKSRQNVSL